MSSDKDNILSNTSYIKQQTSSLQSSLINGEKDDSNTIFDQLLSRIGFGKYQLKALFFISLTNINEGAENVVLSFLVSILSNEWGLTAERISFMGSFIWFGFLIGSLVSGPIADRYGRKKPLNIVTLLLYIFAVLCSFSDSFTYLLIIRSIYGFLGGFQTPLCLTYLAEILPKEVRGKVLILAGASFTLGQLFACFVAFFTLESTSRGDWRTLFLWVAQPTILSWVGINFFLTESPRYEVVIKKDLNAGLDILKKIAVENNTDFDISAQEKEKLARWMNKNESPGKKNETKNFTALFDKDNRKITLYLWPMWFALCLVSYGVIYILPLTLSAIETEEATKSGKTATDDKSSLWGVVFPVLGEVPASTVAYFIIELNLFGRRKTMIYGFIIASVACLFAFCFPGFILWVTIARGVFEAVFLVIFPYTLELYPTIIRVTGLGMSSSFGRLGGIAMPWVSLLLYKVSPKLPYLGFSILGAIGAWCSWTLKFDTTKKELDFMEMEMIHA